MRAKKEERKLAEILRRERGLSYREIAAITGVSKSTLSSWLRDIPLSPEGRARLQKRMRANQATFAARAWPINRARHQKARERAYIQGASVVERLECSDEMSELALAMLYLGDGSKTGGAVRLGSVNPQIMAYFVTALRSLYQIDEDRLSCRLHLINVARDQETVFIRWWSEKIDVDVSRFGPAAYDRRSKATHITDDYRGVCVVTYCDTYIQQRILGLARTYIRTFPNLDQ